MNFNVRNIGGDYQEMTVDAIETGTLDKKEAIGLAQKMVSAAEELLRGCDVKAESQMCGTITENLTALGDRVDAVVKCPRCDREVEGQELGKARIDGDLMHVKCAQDEIDEIGMDDLHNW